MDENEFLKLLKLNESLIAKICRIYRDSPQDREDLFQEIIYQLWRAVDSFRSDSKVSTFIYKIALNTALTAVRKSSRSSFITFTDVMPVVTQVETDQINKMEVLNQALKILNEGERAIIAMALDEISYREIAEVIGISENNVAVKINRIKTKLKTQINKM